jgi:lipopolysaccharide export system permease protein
MQFFWKYIDDLMGKGISVSVIVELLFYVSASLIPLALPLAILLSSIMTLGNLSENNELTALKSSGLSLYRIIRPLTGMVLIIATCTFFFANYIIPVANFKWHSIIFDIQNTKISTILTPGAYSKSLDGYAIKVDEGTEDEFKGILIHDHTSPIEIKTIRAEEGKIYKSENGKYIFFELKNGTVMEELTPQPPSYDNNGVEHSSFSSRPSRRSTFSQSTYKIDLTGFDLNHSQEDLFKDKHEMLNVFQINYAIDSIQKNGREVIDNFLRSMKNDHPYFQSIEYETNSRSDVGIVADETLAPDTLIVFDKLSKLEKINAIKLAQTKLRKKNENLKSQLVFMGAMEHDMDKYLVEFHRKFALTCAIIVLFFVGAPLGAIVRKGGFGAPVVIAALLFMVYFVLITIGDNLAKSDTVSPFLGMWFATMVLAPIAIWLMRAAANDSPVFSFPLLKKLIKRKR